MIITILIIIIAAWILYSIASRKEKPFYPVIVSSEEKTNKNNELEQLASQFNLSDYSVANLKANYLDKHKFVTFDKVKNELHSIENYHKNYGHESNLSFNDFQKECIHHICSGVYDDNNTLELFVKNNLTKRLQNRPLPNKIVDKYNVPKNESFDEIDFPEDISSLKLNVLAQINYVDAKGQESERRITMKSISETYDGDYVIQSYCHEKNAQRTFKLSRITRLVDMETGEVFTDVNKYFLDRYNDSPLGLITKCFQALEAEILVLTFVARADGYLRKKEREIIVSFISQKYSENLDSTILENEIRRTYCDSGDFRTALKKISKKTITEKQLIFDTANNIVATDKKEDPIEIGTLELIEKELGIIKANA